MTGGDQQKAKSNVEPGNCDIGKSSSLHVSHFMAFTVIVSGLISKTIISKTLLEYIWKNLPFISHDITLKCKVYTTTGNVEIQQQDLYTKQMNNVYLFLSLRCLC